MSDDPRKLDYATPQANSDARRRPDQPIVGSIGCLTYSLLAMAALLVLLQPCGRMNWTPTEFGAILSLIILCCWRAHAAAKTAGMTHTESDTPNDEDPWLFMEEDEDEPKDST
jgi:hypothetical protein